MKKRLFTILSCLIMITCILTGCGGEGLKGGPSANDTVYGNGGYVVRKGDYIYYANSYSTKSISENENEYGDETLAAIYRTKVNSRGVVDTDEDGNPKKVEILAKQIAGFNKSGIYIFGDYIYYATPKTLKVKAEVGSSQLLEGLLSFERVKLDGTEHKTIYSIDSLGEDLDYSFNLVGKNVCLTVLNEGTLKTVLVDLATGKKKDTKTLAKDVTEVIFPEVEDIAKGYSVSSFNSYVYFKETMTIAGGDGYDGSRLSKTKINGSSAVKPIEDNTTKTLVSVKNNRVYYTEDSYLYSTADFETAQKYSNSKITSYLVNQDSNGTDMGIVGVLGNSIVYYRALGDYTTLFTADKAPTLLYIENNQVYYTLGDNTLYSKTIYKASYAENEKDIAGTIHSKNINITTSESTVFDFEQNYFFYFNTVEESNGTYSYMHMVKPFATNEEGEVFEQFIGKLAKSDIKKDEE